MSEYTPTTEEVREGFGEAFVGDGSMVDPDDVRRENKIEFDRWLEQHDREVIVEYRSNLLKIHERLRKKPGYSVENLVSFIRSDFNLVKSTADSSEINKDLRRKTQ